LSLFVVAGCGSGGHPEEPPPVPTPIGRGPEFLPARAGPLGASRFSCRRGALEGPTRAHVELFARRRVVIVPPRIGVEATCRYPVRTLDPTGVVELDDDGLTLGDYFAVWRMPFGPQRLLSFRGPVSAFVGGKRWRGDVRAVPLEDEAEIVVEIGGYVRPHRFYLFPPR
jgi:hypothetical protein